MTDEARRKSRGLRAWHAVLAMLGLLIVAVVLWMVAKGSSIKRQLAEIRSQGHPTSLAELSEMNQLPPGVENAAPLYEDALAIYVKPTDPDNTPYAGSGKLPPRGQPLAEAMVSAIEDYLTDNQETLDLLRAHCVRIENEHRLVLTRSSVAGFNPIRDSCYHGTTPHPNFSIGQRQELVPGSNNRPVPSE